MAGGANFSNFKELAGQLKALLPEVRSYVRHPRRMGTWLEEHNPWLGRQLLGVASNLADPYLAGMGLIVAELGDSQVTVSMPSRWRNHGEGGVVHPGAIVTLATFTSRIYWERHLNLSRHELQTSSIQARLLKETSSDTRAVMTFSEGERESLVFRLRSEGSVTAICPVTIFDDQGRLVAEVTIEWTMAQAKQLAAGRNG